jgi:hypothetical protein
MAIKKLTTIVSIIKILCVNSKDESLKIKIRMYKIKSKKY